MYHVGSCLICQQGLLEILKDAQTGKIYICCDECEVEWENPSDALKCQNGTRGRYGKIAPLRLEEILQQKWEADIFELPDQTI